MWIPSPSKTAIKNILLSTGDQVAHLLRWHTWVNRPPIHHVHGSIGRSRSLSWLGKPPERLLFDNSEKEQWLSLVTREDLFITSKAWSCIVVKSSHACSHTYQGCLKAANTTTFQTPGNQLKLFPSDLKTKIVLADGCWKRIITKVTTCKIIFLSSWYNCEKKVYHRR